MKSIRIPFSFEEGSVSSTTNVDTIVGQEVVNYFMTINGERIMNQQYGGNLPKLSFEINDPLVLADYKLDAISDVNSNLSFGKVLDIAVLDSENTTFYEENVATVIVRYAVTPRTVSTVKLTVTNTFNEESDI
ncbi:hypothetical protein EB001_00790 [bacterium]|nr:hypothetical protein [bacterium]